MQKRIPIKVKILKKIPFFKLGKTYRIRACSTMSPYIISKPRMFVYWLQDIKKYPSFFKLIYEKKKTK